MQVRGVNYFCRTPMMRSWSSGPAYRCSHVCVANAASSAGTGICYSSCLGSGSAAVGISPRMSATTALTIRVRASDVSRPTSRAISSLMAVNSFPSLA
jgi:hypothetical protein